ncbi:MAG: hypothetical protein IPJ65_37335 [Archangiaceae bacterium]|nr:hypothetical protein [Archangiaceae bacterium]
MLPIVAPGVDDGRLVNELNREVMNVLAETDHVTMVAREDVDRRLIEEGGRCPPRGKERTDCLERVALATRAVYVVAVTVKRLGKEYELSGSIADADRVLLEQPEPLSVTDNGSVKLEVALKHQLRALLLERMKVGALPTDPRMLNQAVVVAPAPVPAAGEPPPQPPLEPASRPVNTMRVGAFLVGGIAVIAGVSGIVLAMIARQQVSGLSVMDGILQNPGDAAKVSASRTNATIGAAMGAVAGAALVAAVVMFIAAPSEEPRASVAPVAFVGGAGLAFTGRWP